MSAIASWKASDISQVHGDPDVAIELFLLEPTGEPVVGEHIYQPPEDEPEDADE